MDADAPSDGVVVLEGDATDGLRWIVSVDASDRHLLVMLNLFLEGRYVSGFGFDGSILFGATVLESARGRADDLPWQVVARTCAAATRVVATTVLGNEVDLTLSRFIPEFGSRFAAAVMPGGEAPASVRVESDGALMDAGPQPHWGSDPGAEE